MIDRKEIVRLIELERDFQDIKWVSHKDLSLVEWMSILSEEVGELAQEINEVYFADDQSRYDNMLHEAIQVAAVIVAMLENVPTSAENMIE